jgi:hypothetical protein
MAVAVRGCAGAWQWLCMAGAWLCSGRAGAWLCMAVAVHGCAGAWLCSGRAGAWLCRSMPLQVQPCQVALT